MDDKTESTTSDAEEEQCADPRKRRGKALQRNRKEAGFRSAKAFADHLGLEARTYTSYEQGVRSFSIDQACELASALNCSLDDLVDFCPSTQDLSEEQRAQDSDSDTAMDSRRIIGRKLQARRREAGFKSAKAFAEHVGVNPSTYTQYEQGLVTLSFERAWQFAKELGCTVDSFSPANSAEPDGRESRGPKGEDARGALNRCYELMGREGRAVLLDAARLMSRGDAWSADPQIGDDEMGSQYTEWRREIGRALQRHRKEAGFRSAGAFAEHCGIKTSTYTDYEQGRGSMSYERAWEFADVLGCTLDSLGGRVPPRAVTFDDPGQETLNACYEAMGDEARERLVGIAQLIADPTLAGMRERDGGSDGDL